MTKREAKQVVCRWAASVIEAASFGYGYEQYVEGRLTPEDQVRIGDAMLSLVAELDGRGSGCGKTPPAATARPDGEEE